MIDAVRFATLILGAVLAAQSLVVVARGIPGRSTPTGQRIRYLALVAGGISAVLLGQLGLGKPPTIVPYAQLVFLTIACVGVAWDSVREYGFLGYLRRTVTGVSPPAEASPDDHARQRPA